MIVLDGTSGITSPNETITGSLNTPNTFGFKNRIINGGMVIDQRNAGASVTNIAGYVYSLDRFLLAGSQASKFTVQQNASAVTPPVGFSNYLGATSSSAYTVGVAEQFFITQRIEGLNVSDLAWGTASASTVTLSFQVRSSLTGTFGGSLQNSANNRSYPFTYSIPVANTWTTISITVAGDTTGTWLTTNGIGIQINFSIGAGTSASGTAGSWAGSAYYSATGATSVVGTSGATFYITGVQLEKGSVATSFDYRPYGTELSLCQRYLPAFTNTVSGAYTISNAGGITTTTTARITIPFQVAARVPPTGLTTTAASGFFLYNGSQLNQSPTAVTLAVTGIYQSEIQVTFPAVSAAGQGQFTCFWFQTLGAQLLFTGCEL
jgi:hypothetical protein